MNLGFILYRRGSEPNNRLDLKLRSYSIGADSGNDLRLDDRSVSDFHALLTCLENKITIEDVGSTNGTFVNNKPLAPHTPYTLRNQDSIRIGMYTLKYVIQSQPKPRILSAAPQPGGNYSTYFTFLPPFYRTIEASNPLNAILLICESILSPLDQMIDHMHYYFNPHTAPEAMLPWLATWLQLVLDENWPEQRRRQLLSQAAALYRRRGTRGGLQDYLEIYTGIKPLIIEPGQPEGADLPDHVFRVVVDDSRSDVDRALVRQIIEVEKPAHTAYQLVFSTLAPASD